MILKKILATAVSGLIFLISFELGLNALAPIYRYYHPQLEASSAENLIVVLGESTSSDLVTGNARSWPSQLDDMLQSADYKFKIVNFSDPGLVTTDLLRKLHEFLNVKKPRLVISMMGVNDKPHFWYRDYDLIKDEKSGFHFKSLKLLKVLLNYKDFADARFLKPKDTSDLVASSLDFPAPETLIQKLNQYPKDSKEYKKATAQIEEFLVSKTATEKSQFYSYLGFKIDKPAVAGNPSGYLKALDFFKLSVFSDAQVTESLEMALYYAIRSRHREECKPLLQAALQQNAPISDQSFGKFTYCVPDDYEYLNKLMARKHEPYVFTDSEEVPTVRNYKAVFDLLMSRDVCWIAMGYPRQELPDAIKQFENSAETGKKFFPLENKLVFEEALTKTKYESLFIDSFGNNFGHMTEDGARLISKNVLQKIQSIKSNGLCGF